jgi:hypothetical protein
MVNRNVLESSSSGICALYKLGSKSTRTCSMNKMLAKSIKTGLPKNMGFQTAACANSDKLFIIIIAN